MIDFDPGEWFERKPFQQKVIAEIPIDVFAGNVALMATISDISPSVLHKVTDAILTQSVADLPDFKCSQSTAARKMKYANHICMISKEDVQQAINESPYPCIVHFDGKTLIKLNKEKTIKTDRLVVLLNIEGETHLLGVPPLPSSSGEDQCNGVMDLLKKYNPESKVGQICFDTTASNTGLKKGSLIRISNNMGKHFLLIACRHHVCELRMFHFCNSVSDKHSTGPDDPMFKDLKFFFESVDLNYNQTELIKFDWKAVRGTFLEKAARESLNFCQEYITKGKENKDFIREDRKELAEFVVSYLSPSSVTLRKPGAVYHARFLSKALYYLKLQLLSSQLEFVNQNNKFKTEIRLISEFTACFYAK